MHPLTQKYAIIHFESAPSDGYEFSMDDWPFHVTIADVFAISTKPSQLLDDLHKRLNSQSLVNARTITEEWFGERKTIRVSIIEKTKELAELHEEVLNVLKRHNVVFNNPEYTLEGFRPHATISDGSEFKDGVVIKFDSLSLVDMFPGENPSRRKVLGTIHFQKF